MAGSASALWRARYARRYPPPPNPPSHDPTILLGLRRPKIGARLTDPSRRNIIAPIRGSERWVAGFKSKSRPASDRNRWPASYWNAWPASSESAVEALTEILPNYHIRKASRQAPRFFDGMRAKLTRKLFHRFQQEHPPSCHQRPRVGRLRRPSCDFQINTRSTSSRVSSSSRRSYSCVVTIA